jgi:predicted NUDIX family NTP pyrophosphohydrolase
MYRRRGGVLEVFLVHPGGPYWTRKDAGAWSIPKGQYEADEEPLAAARREFQEETGFEPSGDFQPLGSAKQPSGKLISAWAFEGDCDPSQLKSNTMEMEWPPRSGRQIEIPEVDRGGWFTIPKARVKLIAGQLPFLDRFELQLAHGPLHLKG